MTNDLAAEPSPYLRKHGHDPINWKVWGEEAFALARSAGRPVLVSIGYLACYWCHVMARETYGDPRVIAAINRDFIAIKVDREQRPDIDRSVLDAMAALGGRTGWPVTAFLTPEGEVFAGGSYFPPEPRHGLPGFISVLADALADYHQGRPREGRALTTQKSALASTDSVIDVEAYSKFLSERLFENIDPIYGGFGQVGPRFPQVSAHQLLWTRYMISGAESICTGVTQSLQRICRSALYDHVGAGFHRYCSDDTWRVPHFEKMLYDNAQMIELLSWVWRQTRAPLFKSCVEQSISWALREMLIPGCGFASSQAAYAETGDASAGNSGEFYSWSDAEIREILADRAPLFFRYYELSDVEETGRGVLCRIEGTPDEGPDYAALSACRDRLFQVRAGRRAPARDDKVLSDWNGLMIAALAEAAVAFGRDDWLSAASQAFDQVVEQLDQYAALSHCLPSGARAAEAFIEDYAAMSKAALHLHEALCIQKYLDHAIAWVDRAHDLFWDGAQGGYFMNSVAGWESIRRIKSITETSFPSGNAIMIGVLAKLHTITGDHRFRDRAEQIVATFRNDITRHGIASATAVNNTLTLGHFVKIEIFGDPDAEDAQEFHRLARNYALPGRLVIGPFGEISPGPSARQRTAAQMCVGTVCLLPTTSETELKAMTAPGGLSRFEVFPEG